MGTIVFVSSKHTESALEKWFHDLSSWNKFSRQWQNKIFEYLGTKHFCLCTLKITHEYLSTSLKHCAQIPESSWVHIGWRFTCTAYASADGPRRHRPAADSWGYRLWLPPCTHTSTCKGYARAVKLNVQKPLLYHAAQQKYTLHEPSAL